MLTKQDISAIENQINIILPTDYKNFLFYYGGFGFDEYVDFPFLEEYSKDERGLIDVFLGIQLQDNHKTYELLKNYFSDRRACRLG
jgi:hypothetical protein